MTPPGSGRTSAQRFSASTLFLPLHALFAFAFAFAFGFGFGFGFQRLTFEP